MLTTDLAIGSTWAEALTWDQHQRDLIGESLFRFVFRSLYRMRAFNGDPHPGNYLFHGDGRITFLDFGLVRYFSDSEIRVPRKPRQDGGPRPRPGRVPRLVEQPGCSCPGHRSTPRTSGSTSTTSTRRSARTADAVDEGVRERHRAAHVRPVQPIAQYATVPRAFVFIQRINLGLYALLGDLGATGNYRRVAEELWPFSSGPPSTPMGEAEQRWLRTQLDGPLW